jgi:N utilization substance protein B
MPVRAETRARAFALQLLYAWDVGGAEPPQGREAHWSRLAGMTGAPPRVEDRGHQLAALVAARQGEIDGRIVAAADRWRLERLGVVDRNILRLAAAELLEGETPARIVLDEAVRLAQWFGGPRSPAFVNGVLDRIARDLGRL